MSPTRFAVRFALGGVLALLVLLAVPASGAAAQEWGAPQPAEGPAGTSVTIEGNLIGCYATGPGLESSTWGFPERVAVYFDDEVRSEDQSAEFLSDLADDPTRVDDLRELASYDFGEAGWDLRFDIPDATPGPHILVLSFQPMCNNRSVDAPDGFTQNPGNSILSFCVTDDGTCPSSSSVTPSGQDLGGGVRGVRTGTGSVDVLGGQIRTNIFIGTVATVAAVAVGIAGIVALVTAASAATTTAAVGAAAAPAALPAVTATLVAETTVVPGTFLTVGELLAPNLSAAVVRGLSADVLTTRAALAAVRAGVADATQIAWLAARNLLVP